MNLLTTNDYPVFGGYRDYLKLRAGDDAELEYPRFIAMVKRGEHLQSATPSNQAEA